MKHRAQAAAVSALLVFLAASAHAAATSPTPASGTTWDPNQRVEYRWRVGDEPPAWMRAAVNAAAADSNSSRASKAAFLAYAADGESWIAYTPDIPTTWAIGYTVRNIPSSFSVRLRPHGYPLDWGALRWCEFYDSPPFGCYDAEMITLHELGHAQTLGHVDEADVTSWTDSIMHAAPKTKSKAGWTAHEFGRCDVARLQIRYEPSAPSTRYSTCLDLPTDLSLSASRYSAPYYGAVTLTARLRVGDDAIYPNLASDDIAGRRVTLQRRPAGMTAWTVVGELEAVSGDPGRYSATVNVTGAHDWRAVFADQSLEGLQGSVSQVIRVSLSYECAPMSLDGGAAPAGATC